MLILFGVIAKNYLHQLHYSETLLWKLTTRHTADKHSWDGSEITSDKFALMCRKRLPQEICTICAMLLIMSDFKTAVVLPELVMLTYCYFPKIYAVIKCTPRTLLEVGCPGLLDALSHALSLFPLQPVPSWNSRRPRDPIGSWVSIPSRNTAGAL